MEANSCCRRRIDVLIAFQFCLFASALKPVKLNFSFVFFQGHELVLHVLYHLYSMMILDSDGSSTYASAIYEKFLLVVVSTLSSV